MIFQQKFSSVFLLFVMHLRLNDSLNTQRLNKTLFIFNHPSNCKRNEFYSMDYFLCVPCDINANLQPSISKLSCECTPKSNTFAYYDTMLRRPICMDKCAQSQTKKCGNSTTIIPKILCSLKFVNSTINETYTTKHIRIYSSNSLNKCDCDTSYNYLHSGFCIWKELLKNYLTYDAYWHGRAVYKDLKFIAFSCRALHNITDCNYLANLCVQSFFDTDKNSPCRIFFLSQASDASIYSSASDDLRDLRPFLFYKKGKDTVTELKDKIDISESKMELFAAIYSLKGQLVEWEHLQPSHVSLCGQHFDGPFPYFQYFKEIQIACDLKLKTIIDLASNYANHRFLSVFLNYTSTDNNRYMQTIPVLIENAFDGNMEEGVGEWQLAKRFQIISASNNPGSGSIPVYDEFHKLKRFKFIRVLRKFQLRCSVTDGNKVSLPLIVLRYHQIDLTPNISLDHTFNFEFSVIFEKEKNSEIIYRIGLPVVLLMSFVFALFKSYIEKCRRNVEWCQSIIGFSFFMHLSSAIGISLLIIVLIDMFYSFLITLNRPTEVLMWSLQNIFLLKILIYIAVCLKGFHFFVHYWKIAHIDIFFMDWERPKSNDASLILKNNLETSSQCSSTRAFTENNVSAWRTFFIANEWITLGSKQKVSPLMQGLASMTLYWIITNAYPSLYLDSIKTLFLCIVIFSSVHVMQRIFTSLILNYLLGNPIQKFTDICTMANVSIFTLLDSSFGFYIHGRSPHGFSDTDMPSMILQLQRESQNMCAKRGLLNDSDFQTYIILPPLNLKSQIEKLLQLNAKSDNLSQAHFQKRISSIGNNFEGALERTTIAYNRVNRFLCAFIDHAIKDMDYIIKERTFVERILDCEFESFLSDNKGTFYIDNGLTFSNFFLFGNQNQIFVMELLLLIAMNLLTSSFVTSVVVVCIFNKLFQQIFHIWTRNNVSTKTLIDKRFLI